MTIRVRTTGGKNAAWAKFEKLKTGDHKAKINEKIFRSLAKEKQKIVQISDRNDSAD